MVTNLDVIVGRDRAALPLGMTGFRLHGCWSLPLRLERGNGRNIRSKSTADQDFKLVRGVG
jgi:hypothetical protein